MEYTGLTGRYPINRLLTEAESQHRLHPLQKLEVEPAYQLSVIRSNSTYLELVDKFFSWKGFMTTFAVIAFLIAGVGCFSLAAEVARDAVLWSDPHEDPPWVYAFLFLLLGLLIAWGFVRILRYESFAYTHYPIRLNRKTRMVHVFRLDGSVLSVPWEEVFFCMGRLKQGFWEIQGHVLDKDGATVRETFALPHLAGSEREREQMKRYWEFVRRYMEEGPASVAQEVKFCLPIAQQREPLDFGFHRMSSLSNAPVILRIVVLLMYVVILPGRYFAMRTSKIPQWPEEVEAGGGVASDDPYVRHAGMNERWQRLPDWLWLLISGAAWAGIVYGASHLTPWR